jgi:hypothetical protein
MPSCRLGSLEVADGGCSLPDAPRVWLCFGQVDVASRDRSSGSVFEMDSISFVRSQDLDDERAHSGPK